MDKKVKTFMNILEELGWTATSVTCNERECWIEISNYSPAGEDINFIINVNDIFNDVKDLWEDFDPDEHAAMWYNAKNRIGGVPSSLTVLVKDAWDIKNMLEDLTIRVSEVK